jgi:hypothetical protein
MMQQVTVFKNLALLLILEIDVTDNLGIINLSRTKRLFALRGITF